jgi:hypothetical protein
MAFRDQLLAGEHDRVARHAQLSGQLTRRRQPPPRRERSTRDGFDQLLADLALKIQMGARIDAKQELWRELALPCRTRRVHIGGELITTRAIR